MAPSFPIDFTGQRESKKCSQKGLMMGKTRKISKGHSYGFVPDYRHAVETMAESEGFGSSGRVETEIAASEDSCAPHRKCISLNVDSRERFGVHIQVLSLSKMSRSERKNLEVTLKRELEQIRLLQNKIASMSSNVVPPPPSDIHRCSDEQKRVVPERPVGVSLPQGKKRAPPGRKRPATGRVDSAKQSFPQSSSIALLMKQCQTLLSRLMLHQHGWVFNTPVDVVKLNIPDYFNVIKHPMDLGTVKTKLASGEYPDPLSFAADVRLTFSNALTYNPPGNDVHIMAEILSKFFEMRWKPIEKKIPLITKNAPEPSKRSHFVELETSNFMPPLKKKHIAMPENNVKQEPTKRIMTDVEKIKISTELEASLEELPDSIIDFLKQNSHNASEADEDEIEIDVDTFSDDTLFTLRKLLDEFMVEKHKKQAKAETHEKELQIESGFSNSAVQPCKGNDPIDEDVDIGGNDPPISSFPPVELDKDNALRNKCSSSGSSSSGSHSSSSDSESGSSSGSELNVTKASAPMKTEESLGAVATTNSEQKKTDSGDRNTGNQLLNGLGQVEQDSQSKTDFVEGNSHQDGESAPPERQVSPDKLYRAALLRSRFADTIIKAQEKSFVKDENQDPEKLRLEKEELERRRREEKARLQAEALAAEEARQKVEADAAAEAKRKRELDREAARQALHKMEKTVDINENCRFMKDLEMLSVGTAEDLHSLIEKTSPDHGIQERLGSFKFQGNSNPLEQLGLYMKADDDDEDGDPPSLPSRVDEDDAEEGEID